MRLWLHGEEESAYLGLMQKTESGLRLVKKFSRRDMRQFPGKIEYASDSGESARAVSAEQTDIAAEALYDEEPEREERGADGGGLIWYSGRGGVLTAFDGAGRLAAFPSELRGRVCGADIRYIEGREYIVFRY